ncbi:hypothetical protein C8J57DRAFT_1022661, partial [Mycena rebaudengoi]
LTKDEIRHATKVRDDLVGDPKKATAEKATQQKDGTWKGGINIERSERSINLGTRCYTISTTVQTQLNMHAPAKGSKDGPDPDKILETRRDLLELTAMLGAKGIKNGPVGLAESLETHANLNNVPRIGHHDNTCFPVTQLNLAPPTESNSAENLPTMGKFGVIHIDGGDDPAGWSHMTVLSNLTPEVEPGYFFLADAGVVFELNFLASIFFNGLHFHGGTAPTFKSGVTVGGSIIRMTCIGYGPSAFVGFPAALSGFAACAILMSTFRSHIRANRPWCQQATYIADGGTLMQPLDHFQHGVWGIVSMAANLIQQYDPNMLARIDVAKICGAFSMVLDCERVACPVWHEGPGHFGDDVQIGKI